MQTNSLEKQIMPLRMRVASLKVINWTDYEIAGQLLKDVAGVLKQIDDLCDPSIQQAHKAHKEAIALKKKLASPLETAVNAIKKLMLDFQTEQERQAKEEQKKRLIEQQQTLQASYDALNEAKQEGQIAKAEEIRGKIENILTETKTPSEQPIKVEGIATRKIWDIEIIDESLIPRAYLMPDMVKLRKVANATKGAIAIDGVKIIEKPCLTVRAEKEVEND